MPTTVDRYKDDQGKVVGFHVSVFSPSGGELQSVDIQLTHELEECHNPRLILSVAGLDPIHWMRFFSNRQILCSFGSVAIVQSFEGENIFNNRLTHMHIPVIRASSWDDYREAHQLERYTVERIGAYGFQD